MRVVTAPVISYALASLLVAAAAAPPPNDDLRGFGAEAAKVEREWEAKFRAIPSPDSLREYMRRLSARPHHVGSPYDHDNAEWILAKFKSFGLDAHIETFDVRVEPEARSEEHRLNSSHEWISYAVFCLKKKKEVR